LIETPHGWLVIQCKGGWEERAKRDLEAQEYADGCRYEVYLPWCIMRRTKRGKPYDAREPLFPRHLFLAKHVGVRLEDLRLGAVNNTRGVIRVLSVTNKGLPNMVADRDIAWIRERCEADGGAWRYPGTDAPLVFTEGDTVRLKHGPLSTFPAEFVRYEKKGTMAYVRVHLFGRPVATIVSPDELRAAS
jgi:transcription antitermination factor NusG